jgi:secreted trypsin-like serine protease
VRRARGDNLVRTMSSKWWLFITVVMLPASLPAITTFSNPALYVVPVGGIYSGIAEVQGPSGSCTGSLISPDVVLTAAHCLQSSLTVTFADAIGSPAYTAIQQVADPGYNPSVNPVGIDDVALILLNTDVAPGITIYNLNTNVNVVGDTITVAGYGESGQDLESLGYGTLRAGLNVVSGLWNGGVVHFGDQTQTLENLGGPLAYDFNQTSSGLTSGTAPANEAFICFGDSGGPSFLGNVLGSSSTPTIAGVHDFLAAPSGTTSNCGAGNIAGDQNVALFSSFITSTEADFSAPEPGTLAMLVAGLGVFLGRRLRDR